MKQRFYYTAALKCTSLYMHNYRRTYQPSQDHLLARRKPKILQVLGTPYLKQIQLCIWQLIFMGSCLVQFLLVHLCHSLRHVFVSKLCWQFVDLYHNYCKQVVHINKASTTLLTIDDLQCKGDTGTMVSGAESPTQTTSDPPNRPNAITIALSTIAKFFVSHPSRV